MPRVAQSSATQCLAFGKKDVRRCRLEKEAGRKTCRFHRGYYHNWFQKNPVTGLFSEKTEREQEEYLFQICGRHVEIPEDYLRTLRTGNISYFRLLMENSSHSPMVNATVFVHYVKKCILRYPADHLEPYLVGCLKDVESCRFLFEGLIHEFSRFLGRNEPQLEALMEKLHLTTQHPEWRHLLFSTRLYDCFRENADVFRSELPDHPELWQERALLFPENPIRVFGKAFNRRHAAFLKRRCAVYKEELIAVALHPTRIERWLALGFEEF